jgi:DNA gyrase subunit A
VVRRTQFDLKKAQDRAHILAGLRIALDHIDEIVALIRASSTTEEANEKLMQRFGLSEIQAKAITDMRLKQLTGLEREKIEQEYQELMKLIEELTAILASRDRRMQIIKSELEEMRERYGDARRTEITDAVGDVDIEDMIAEEDMVITMTHEGYIKRTATTEYRSQGRGGKGVKGMDSKENDFISTLFVASTHAYILFFTNKGRCYRLKVYKIPEAGRASRGRPIVNLIELQEGEKVAALVPVREFDDTHSIIAVTERGIINKQLLTAYANVNRSGVKAYRLNEGDSLIEVKLTSGGDDVILGTAMGQALRFHESAARNHGRGTGGIRGTRLRPGDKVVGMIIASEENDILTVTDRGYGKRTLVAEYRTVNRGGSGIKNIRLTNKNGHVVALKRVHTGLDVMLITKNGIIIRMDVDLISQLGRYTQGLKLINLDEGDSVIDIALCDHDDSGEDDAAVITAQAPVETAPEDAEAADAAEEEEDEVAEDGDVVDDADETEGEDGADVVDDTEDGAKVD